MARKSREDGPGTLHHSFNRGLARRTVFEARDDVRYFLSRLARVHRLGILETHGFSFLTNHFHLIAREILNRLHGPATARLRRLRRGLLWNE